MQPKETYGTCEHCKSKDTSCFRSLKEDRIQVLGEHKSHHSFAKKEILFKEGTRATGVYCIKKGKLKIYKVGFDGKAQIIQVSKEGDLLGYRALISGEPYPVTAETLEDTEACFIGENEFTELLKTSKELNNTLLKQACHELGNFAESLTNQAQLSVRERCAVSLYHLYKVYGGTDDNTIEINLTREDLANIVGTATETLIRLIHDFKDEGILDSKGRKINILNAQKLKSIGHIFN